MGHYEPPHQDLRCLRIQLYLSLVLKELSQFYSVMSPQCSRCGGGGGGGGAEVDEDAMNFLHWGILLILAYGRARP